MVQVEWSSTTLYQRFNFLDSHENVNTYPAVLRYTRPAAKEVGQFIRLSDGTPFRLSTVRGVSTAWYEPKTPQQFLGTAPLGSSSPASIRTSPGGLWDDLFSIGINMFEKLETGPNAFTDYPWDHPKGARNEAVTKALNKIGDNKANVGENLGTLGQTMRMLKAPVTELVRSLRSFYKEKSLRPYISRSVRQLRRDGVPETVAKRYLEYVYGWKPLMQDIHNLMEMAKESGGKSLQVSSRATARRESTGQWSSQFGRKTDAKLSSKSRTSVTLWAEIDPNWGGARTLNQLGLLNPLGLAWDLMSYSFVVDWLLPIGPVLNALSAPAGLRFIDGSIATRVTSHADVSIVHDPSEWIGGAKWTTQQPGTGVLRYEGYRRDRVDSWPIPGFWFDPDPLRGDRPLKALALMVTSIPR